MEINPKHKLIAHLRKMHSEQKDITNLAHLLYDTAALSSGCQIENPASFGKRIIQMMNIGCGLEDGLEDETVVEPVVESTSEINTGETNMETVD